MKETFTSTWFIALMFALTTPTRGITTIIGIVLLIKQYNDRKGLIKKYGEINSLDQVIADKDHVIADKDYYITELEEEISNKEGEISTLEESLSQQIKEHKQKIADMNKEKDLLESELKCKHYNFSDYDALSSEECKNKLALLKTEESALIKNNNALIEHAEAQSSKKVITNNEKQILRCFSAECDNVLLNLTVKNIDSSRSKITRSFESLNRIFSVDGMELSNQMLDYKLKELDLVYTFSLKKEQEKEIQKAIKEQMREEAKAQRELENKKKQLQKDQTQCNNEVKKLMMYMQKTNNDIEKKLYVDKIHELEEKIKELEKEQTSVAEREANAKAGYVYVISNIGSFGKDIYKIGMTRRLEPMDRINELSSASVPFAFDVHAMIFSTDAPELESKLHQIFDKNCVNRINTRKEFFHVSLDKIEEAVKDNFDNTVEFTRIPAAKEYNESMRMIESESVVQ